MTKKKELQSYKAKVKPKENSQKPPRLLLITEGEMEDLGLPSLVNRIVELNGLKFQVLLRTTRVHNGDTIPATKIAKDINKICKVKNKDAEYFACIIDLEGRNITWAQFKEDIKKSINNDVTILGITCRSMENWLLADIEGMISAVAPCRMPNLKNFNTPDNIIHPAERIVKSYWTRYKKTEHGVKFLQAIRPEKMRQTSHSFEDFCNSIFAMNERCSSFLDAENNR